MTHTIEQIKAALAVEREIMGDRGGVVPIEAIRERAGFYPSNEERSRVQCHDFIADPPDHYFAYAKAQRSVRLICGDTITTWTGERLGSITSAGQVWRSNLGDRRQSFRCAAINGCVYAGVAYLDSGDYVRLRRVKHADKRELQCAKREGGES